MRRYAIGVDVGGTFTKLALVSDEGRIILKERMPTLHADAPEPVVEHLISSIQKIKGQAEKEGYTVEGIGIGMPQFIEGEQWIQRECNNMPALEGYAMYPPLEAALGPNIAMDNDVIASGLGEYHFGIGKEYDRVFFIAIGTGIGCAIFTEGGELVRYNYGAAGDIGMIIVDPHGMVPCTCGAKGCLETMATTLAVRRMGLEAVQCGKDTSLAEVFKEKGDLEARDVGEEAKKGDRVARDIIEEAGYFLGVALTSYMHIFRPHIFLVGGGLAEAGELLLEPIRRTVYRLGSPFYLKQLKGIERATLGAEAGMIGCASLILFRG